jgi:multicomponent Na+:H+ antiporter subunit C
MATTALMLSLIIVLYRHYGTLDVREIRRLRG